MERTVTIQSVGTYRGVQESRREYELAKHNMPFIESEIVSPLEEGLKKETGYDDFHLPERPATKVICLENVTFTIKSVATTKRPKYKGAATAMQSYLAGISFLMHHGRTITGVKKHSGEPFIDAARIRDDFAALAAGYFTPGTKHQIKTEVAGALAKEGTLEQLLIPLDRESEELTGDNATLFVRARRIYVGMKSLVKEYEKAVASPMKKCGKKEGTVQVTSDRAYKTKSTTREGPNWATLVQTLIAPPIERAKPGELDIIAEGGSIEELQAKYPHYHLAEEHIRGKQRIYIGIQSVYDRIEQLKVMNKIEGEVVQVQQKEIV